MTFLGWLSDPFRGLSDLQLGDEKGTFNHLDCVVKKCVLFFKPLTLRLFAHYGFHMIY